ncbi:MAG: hypothetical protein EHM40_06285 [Chloroflexi bacterium]|nr:MAG: hypothetical protein EHM40_06285 [Chloroflexota bacterium]
MADDSLERAIGLIQAGKAEAAREQLERILKNDRTNMPAWHWYAQTWPGAKEKARIWQACLRSNPTNQQVQQVLRDLNPEPQRQITSEIRKPAAIPKRTSGPSPWLLWLSIGVLGAVAIFAWMAIDNSTPINPQQYKHVQPVEYYLYVPEAYSADQEWPLFVGIHGAGGNGLHCWQLWQSYAEQEGFILLCPSIPGEQYGFLLDVGERTVWSAIGEVQKEYRIKPRIFFTGFSAGAYFIQAFTCDYPGTVGGLSILSSGMYVDPDLLPELIPILVVIGDQDDPVAVETSRGFVNGLAGYGFDVQYQVMPGVGHSITKDGVNLTIDLFRKRIGR